MAKPTTGYQSVGVKKEDLKAPEAGMQNVLQRDGTYKQFVKPTGANPEAQPAPTVNYGSNLTQDQINLFEKGIKLVKDQTTGGLLNQQGQYVDASGKLVAQPDSISGVVEQTYAEQAESQMRGQFKTDYENALKYGIELPYKSFEEYKNWVQSSKKSDVDYLQKQQDLQRGAEDLQTKTALEGIDAASKGVTATMAQSREGVTTTSKPQFTIEFAGQMQRQIDQIKLERDSAEAQRQQAMVELKRAQASGDVELAQSIQGQLSSIESNIRQIDTQALEASTLANQQALDLAKFESDKSIAEQSAQRANLTTFTGLVDTGVELTTEGIMQFAQNLNVPFEAAYGYYQGSQKIRDDKTLTQEQKQIENAQLAQNLQDTITGQNLAEVKKLSILEDMYKAGASKEEISRAKDAFGLTDQDDPVYQADLRIKLADAKLKEMQANGEVPYGSTEWIERQQAAFDLAKQQKDYYDEYGGSWDTEAFKIGQAVGWCGEYASTLSTAPRVGDMWSEKRGKIEDKNPKIGDKLLIPLGGANGYGHVAVVLGYDPVTGDIQVAESNADGRQNKGAGLGVATFGNYNAFELNQKFGDDWGVAHGNLKPNVASAFNANKSGDNQIYNAMSTAINGLKFGTVDQAKTAKEELKNLIDSGDTQGAKEYLITQVRNNASNAQQDVLDGKENSVYALKQIQSKLDEFVKKNGDTGIFSGLTEGALQKGGLTSDPELAGLANDIAIAIIDYRKAVSGAAFTESEKSSYDAVFPSIGKTSELNKAKIDSLINKFETDTDNFYKRRIGEDKYTTIFGEKEVPAPETFMSVLSQNIYNALPNYKTTDPTQLYNIAGGNALPTDAEVQEMNDTWDDL